MSSIHSNGSRPRFRLLAAGLLLLCGIGPGVLFAAGNPTDLGRPADTISTNQYFPLSGFHKVKTSLTSYGKPEVLLLATYGNDFGTMAMERWPVVKALSQFGRFSGVKAIDRTCTSSTISTGPEAGTRYLSSCNLATFDLSHMQYSSPYMLFSSKDLIRRVNKTKNALYQPLTSAEMKIFMQYAAYRGTPICGHFNQQQKYVTYKCSGFVHRVENSLGSGEGAAVLRRLPLVLIKNYLETYSQILIQAEFSETIPAVVTPRPGHFPVAEERAYSFKALQTALQQEKDPKSTFPTHVVEDINAEANIMTALICHADGKKPASVCGRSNIKSILTHVK